MRKSTGQINAEILAPFFEIANKIICETSIPFYLHVTRLSIPPNLRWGADFDRISQPLIIDEDMSEDTIVAWVIELQAMYDDYFHDPDEIEGEGESMDEIAAYENDVLDQQERRA